MGGSRQMLCINILLLLKGSCEMIYYKFMMIQVYTFDTSTFSLLFLSLFQPHTSSVCVRNKQIFHLFLHKSHAYVSVLEEWCNT